MFENASLKISPSFWAILNTLPTAAPSASKALSAMPSQSIFFTKSTISSIIASVSRFFINPVTVLNAPLIESDILEAILPQSILLNHEFTVSPILPPKFLKSNPEVPFFSSPLKKPYSVSVMTLIFADKVFPSSSVSTVSTR